MKCLGIDPGFDRMGYGLIEVERGSVQLVEYGVIRTSSELSLPLRLKQIGTDLLTVLLRHRDIELVGVEELFFAKNRKTAMQVSEARGVILFTLAQQGLRIEEVKPVQVKMAVTGSGIASKYEVGRMVQLTCGLVSPPEPDDAADAIAIAIAVAPRMMQL